MALILTDNFTQANGTAWNSTRWTVTKAGTSIIDVQNNRGRMNVGTATTDQTNALAKITPRLSQEVKFLINRGAGVGTRFFIVGDALNGAFINNGFIASIVTTGSLSLAQRMNNVSTTLASGIALPAGTDYYVRLRYDDATKVVALRVWAATVAEPTTWNYSGTITPAPPVGVPGFITFGNAATTGKDNSLDNIEVDDLTVSVSVNVVETPATASATAVDPSVSTSRAVAFSATPMTASAAAPTHTFSASTNYKTDFGDYALGVPAGWTKRLGTTYTIEESAGTLSGKWFYGPAGSATTIYTYKTNASVKGNSLSRIYNNGGVTFAYVSNTDYRTLTLETGAAPTLYLNSNVGNITSVPVNANSQGFNWLRVDVSGSRVRAKVWKHGDVEPEAWSLDVAQTTKSGLWGTASFTNRASAYDYYALNTNEGGVAEGYSLGKEIDAVALTATAEFVEPVVSAGTSKEVVAEVATASAVMPEAQVAATANAYVSADVATAFAEAPEASAASPDVTIRPDAFGAVAMMPDASAIGGTDLAVTVGVMTASADMTEPEFSNVTNRIIAAEPMQATATSPKAVDPTGDGSNVEVRVTLYSVDNDPFIAIVDRDFGNVPSSVNSDVWLRFGQKVAGPLRNYALNTPSDMGSWVGSPDFGIRDDYDRPATRFEEDAYAILDYPDATDPRRALTWEMVFRTGTANGPLWSGDSTAGGQYTVGGVNLTDGRINVYGHISGTLRTFGVAAGDRLDDNQWHHVLVTIGSRGLEVFVDGVSRMVRRPGNNNTATGSVPTTAVPAERVGSGTFPQAATFTGDILMFAQYGKQLAREAGNTHFYAYIMATVVNATALTATATMGVHKGRGNRKRALALYTTGGRQWFGDPDPEPNWTTIRLWTRNAFGDRVYDDTPFNYGPYTVYPRRMDVKRNDYDYSPELFTMDDVEDLGEFDMFFFIDVPQPNQTFDDREVTGQTYNLQPQYERFIESVREAIDTGISFWCPQPDLALSLGFIDRLDVHSLEVEPFDIKSYVEDDARFKATLARTPEWYLDTHYINKYRVAASVEGFTDLGGYVIDDFVFWYNYGNPYSQRPDYVKYNVKAKPDGLALNDTVYFPTPMTRLTGSSNIRQPYWRTEVYSIPDGAYRGTAVAKEQTTYNMRGAEVANPRANNALTVVLQPGDNVGGRPIGGKVLVDFMSGFPVGVVESLDVAQSASTQVRPFGTPDFPTMDEYDGYDYDSRRQNTYFSTISTNIETEYSRGGTTRSRTQVFETPYFTEAEKYPIIRRRVFPWLERAFNWLSQTVTVDDGSVRVLAPRMEARAEGVQPTVTVQKHNRANAAPMVALAQFVKPANVNDPDVTVTTLPATATAQMLGLATDIKAEPMTARADIVEPSKVRGSGQDYILSIRHVSAATLYLKEDAV